MSRVWRTAGYVLLGAAIVVLILLAAFLFLTRSRTGVGIVGGYAIERLERAVEGRLQVDSVTTRRLLGGATLHGVSLTDLDGRPFVQADSIRLGYRLRSFLAGEVVFDRATLYRPVVVIERLPGDTLWNFEHIIPPGPPTPDEERSLIEITRARVIDGTVLVRTPLETAAGEEPDTDRIIVRQVPGGLARELRFDRINATVPRIIWETPVEPGRLIEVAALSARGFIWEDPFILDNLRGAVTIRDSLITFDLPAFAMPGSRGSAIGEVITEDERVLYDVRVRADQVAFSDLAWLYPPLDIEGGGTATFRMQTQPVGTLYLVEDARLHAPGTNIAGTFGIVVDDTVYFTQVDLRASPLDLGLLHEIVPDAPVLEGLLVGTVEVEGPISSLTTSGEFGLAARQGERPTASLRWTGTLDLDRPYGATALTADLAGLDLAILRQIWPAAEIGGTISGRLEATGDLDHGVRLNTSLTHRGIGDAESKLSGGGTIAWVGGRADVDLLLNAEQLDFSGLAALAPAFGEIEGEASGTLAARGGLHDLELAADLIAQDGRLQLQGNLALDGDRPRYRAEGTLDDILLDRLLAVQVPRETGFDAHFVLSGEGFDPRTARSELSLQVDSARLARIDLSSANLGLRLEDGVAHIDSLVVTAALGALRAAGTLGLDSTRSGTISLLVNADSLVALQAFLFPDAPVLHDPDSTRGRIDGSARIEAELRGALGALDIDGSARVRRPAIDGAEAQQIALSFRATGVGTDSLLAYHLAATADSLDLYGQKLDRATLLAEFHHGGGWFQLEANAEAPVVSAYHLISGYRPLPGGVELDLRELRAQTGTEEWGLAEPARLRIGTDGMQVDHLLFSRTTGAGRVLARGRIPWTAEEDPVDIAGSEIANLRLEFQQLPLFSLRATDEPPLLSSADINGSVTVTGTALTPRIRVDLSLADTRFSGLHFESISAGLDYVDQRLDATFEAKQDGKSVLTGSGRIPIDLRLMPVEERRLARPLDVTLRADGVPAAVLGSVVDGFRAIEGEIDGIITLAGTTLDPTLGGQLTIRDGAATSIESGVRYRGVAGTARVLGDQIVGLDLTARTTGGSATIGGTLNFQTLTDPTFDLLILARNFQAVQRRDVEMTASGEIRLQGSYSRPEINGKVRVDRGTLFLDEVWRQYQIVALDDPLLFERMDTTFAFEEQIFNEAQSEFVRNMRVNAEIEIQRGSWLRSRQLNVEVTGGLRVELDRRPEDNRNAENIRLTGILNAVRGTYELYVAEELPARRFIVRGGTVEFDGTPGINPGFDITAGYRVRTTDRHPLNVLAIVTGNLQSPRVTLRSEDDESISESDLLSYLIFGRPTYALAGGETRQLDSYLSGLGAGILAPTVLGYWAMLGETIATNFGVVDYVSITPTEADTLGVADGLRVFDPFSALGRAQVEVGWYVGDAWYLAVTRRLGQGVKAHDFGVRAEWRLAPTWTAEAFFEDRFARTGRFGFDQPLESRKIGGFFLFREWGF